MQHNEHFKTEEPAVLRFTHL